METKKPESEALGTLSRYAPVLRGSLAVVFLVLCWRYASGLNLWGDEAYTLGFVEGRIPGADPSHLPTYYTLLKLLTSVVPATNELTLRMLHAVPFALGLLFGALAVRRITGCEGIALASLGIAILLPDFVFYATNLRMYSLIFLATLVNVDALSRLDDGDGTPSLAKLTWYVVSGAALVAIDFPGLFYFGIGAAYLALKWLRAGRWGLLPILVLPLLPLAGFFVANRSLVADLLRWSPVEDQTAPSGNAFEILQWTYLSFRPGLDLVYAAPLPTLMALVLPPALFAVILLGAFRQAVAERGRSSTAALIPLLALSWLVVVPTGFTFTRLFLPSQFFMVVVLVLAARSGGKALRTAATASAVVLVLVNLYQGLAPTYRLDSLVPFRRIADDAIALSAAEGIETVMVSDNSMNVESIVRYMRRHPLAQRIRFFVVNDTELARRAAEPNGRPFLFISHMGQKGAFVDIHRLKQATPRLAHGYVPLQNLPYNDLWKRRYSERAYQPDAVDVWIVR